MEAINRNLTADEGALYELGARWLENGIPKPLATGWTGALVVTEKMAAATEILRQAATLDDDGNVAVQVDPDDLPARGVYAYRLELKEGAIAPRFLMVGEFTVRDARDV